jgi:hypothetical protein
MVPLADRHYNRQAVGAPQFVPPGRCVVLRAERALWVTSWPLAQYVKHDWAGAWVNSTFRKECSGCASEWILEAVAATRWYWPAPPARGLVSFVDPRAVPPVYRRGRAVYGYSYLKAGFAHVGYTKEDGLWVWQLLPGDMPPAEAPRGAQFSLGIAG